MAKTIGMTICATGCANNGLRELKDAEKTITRIIEEDVVEGWANDNLEDINLGMAHIAISCLHDALMALVRGDITIKAAKDFFFGGEVPDAGDYFGDIIQLKPTESQPQ